MFNSIKHAYTVVKRLFQTKGEMMLNNKKGVLVPASLWGEDGLRGEAMIYLSKHNCVDDYHFGTYFVSLDV